MHVAKSEELMIRAIDHINIVVADLERSLTFYTKLLGFTEIRRARLSGEWIDNIVGLKDVDARVVYIVAPAGEPRIELLHYSRPTGEPVSINSRPNTHGLRHIALLVEDIEKLYKRLVKNDVKVFGPPVTVPTGAVKHDAGQKRLLYFLDPDGVILELAEYK